MTSLRIDTPRTSSGAFLIQITDPEEISIPEDLTHQLDSKEAKTVQELKEIIATCARYATKHHESASMLHILAEITAQTFALESIIGRLAGNVGTLEDDDIERRIVKVLSSEIYSRSADAAIQIHGGEKGTEISSLVRFWSDQRLSRMIGGETEADRFGIIDQLLTRDQVGRLALLATAQNIEHEIAHATDMVEVVKTGCPQSAMEAAAQDCKRLTLFLFAKTTGCVGEDLQDVPEITSAIATVIGAAYALESAALRTHKMRILGHPNLEGALLAAQVAVRDYADAAVSAASYALDSMPCEIGTDWRTGSYSGLTDLLARLSRPVVRPVPLRRALAAQVLEHNGYPL